MNLPINFDNYNKSEAKVISTFQSEGYAIVDVEDLSLLTRFRSKIIEFVCSSLQLDIRSDQERFLNNFSDYCDISNLNSLRLDVYEKLNRTDWLRPTYYSLASHWLTLLLGSELAMQNKINLSIQLPKDESSLLPIHADVFSGETPFQIVQWLPLVDCYNSKSMFIAPKHVCEKIYPDLKKYQESGMEKIFEDVEKELIWLDVPFGKVLIFSPNFLHGNIINSEAETRWSLNCRFKGLFTPYTGSEKKLGSFYSPIIIKPVTALALEYVEPGGFSD